MTPISFYPGSGQGHFAASQLKIDFIAVYIKKAVQYRLAVDATATSLATLNPINPTTTGWLVDKWRGNTPSVAPPNTVAAYTGNKAEAYWCFDADQANRVEAIMPVFQVKIRT